MSDIDKRLDNIEQTLKVISTQQAPMFANNNAAPREDEIDLRELFNVLWQGKWVIIAVTFLFAVAGVFYALSLPNVYKSEGIYAPAQKQGGSGGLGGQLGGLASLAGVSLGGGDSNDIDQALVLMKSWSFIEQVINKHNLKPLIMGVKGWNKTTGELIWDENVYDPITKKWLREPTKGQKAEPTSYETYRVFKNILEANYDNKAGMITITVEYYSPVLAKEWVNMIVSAVNEHFQLRDMTKAKKSIAYLQEKINETGIAQMQSVFYGMIEAQTKTLMLAEVDQRYLLVDVVKPKSADFRSSPKRALILILFIFVGGLFIIILLLLRGFLLNAKLAN